VTQLTSGRSRRVVGMVVLTIALGVAGFGARQQLDSSQLLQQVLARIKASGMDALSDSALFIKAAKGLVHELNDPYAELYSPDQLADFRRNSLGNDYAGLGLGIESLNDSITITAVFVGTPAASSGVQRGDRIVAVDTTGVVGWSTVNVSKRLTGAIGTKVRLTLIRSGEAQPVTDELTRATVHVPSVPYTLMFDDHVGYVPLVRVNETATDELKGALMQLREQGARAYVLDLRGNPGGQLDQALDASNLFLDRGTLLATVHSRAAAPEVYVAHATPLDRRAPIVILEDGYTASAAEIIAGALQDHDRALVVGMPSFGKGLVQTMIPLDDGWLLKMTTGRWYTPSGRSIHRDRPFENGHFVSQDSAPLGRTAAAVRAGRPVVRSQAGRTLYGGGGIVPDVIVPMDTLSDREQHVLGALRPRASTARAVLYGLARDLKASIGTSFAPRPEWRAMYSSRLRSAGIAISPAQLDSAAGFIDELIADRVVDIAFGDSAAFRRSSVHDQQFRRALELLTHARDLPSLLKADSTGADG
jgi:carboxyl-terminal processing protease